MAPSLKHHIVSRVNDYSGEGIGDGNQNAAEQWRKWDDSKLREKCERIDGDGDYFTRRCHWISQVATHDSGFYRCVPFLSTRDKRYANTLIGTGPLASARKYQASFMMQ